MIKFIISLKTKDVGRKQSLDAIVISELPERHSKAKRARAPAYSRALRRIKGFFQRVVYGKLRSDFQRVRRGRVAERDGLRLKGLCSKLDRGILQFYPVYKKAFI